MIAKLEGNAAKNAEEIKQEASVKEESSSEGSLNIKEEGCSTQIKSTLMFIKSIKYFSNYNNFFFFHQMNQMKRMRIRKMVLNKKKEFVVQVLQEKKKKVNKVE